MERDAYYDLFKKREQINASLSNCINYFYKKCVFKKREIRNEVVDMPVVNGPIFIQNIFFLLPLQLCELVKFCVFKTSYDFSG